MLTSFRAVTSPKGPYLLGIDFCHIPNRSIVYRKGVQGAEPTQDFVHENTGMAGVIPAWRIIDVLFSDELREMRKQTEKDED